VELSAGPRPDPDTDGHPATLLLVEPIGGIADAMTVALSNAGFETVVTPDPRAALEVVKVAEPDCVIVDVGPGAAAAAAARRLREATLAPMVLLTGRGVDPTSSSVGEPSRPTTILRRPLRLHELVTKIRQALAAGHSDASGEGLDGLLEAGDVILDTRAHTVWVRGERIPMSPRERQLLRVLLLHPGRVLSYGRLLELAWGSDANGSSLSVYLRRLRRKVERDPSNPRHIITLKGIGVRFEVSSP